MTMMMTITESLVLLLLIITIRSGTLEKKKESSRYLSATQWGGGWAVCCPWFFCCLFVFFVFSGLLRFFLNELFSFSYFRFRPSGVPRRTPDLTSQQALSERMAKYYRTGPQLAQGNLWTGSRHRKRLEKETWWKYPPVLQSNGLVREYEVSVARHVGFEEVWVGEKRSACPSRLFEGSRTLKYLFCWLSFTNMLARESCKWREFGSLSQTN